jgi:hypothetical protein
MFGTYYRMFSEILWADKVNFVGYVLQTVSSLLRIFPRCEVAANAAFSHILCLRGLTFHS